MQEKKSKKAWVVAVDMGFGHQRTAHALRDVAHNGAVINANNYPGIPGSDRKFWDRSRASYEFISRFRRIPIIGLALFLFLDSFQRILGYYPKRDLSKANFGGKSNMYLIKNGWLKDLIMTIKKNPIPLISTFFTPALAAEYYQYPGDIYCVICDADVNRAWVALDPKKSRIKYFASCAWSRDRLKLYGVPSERIIFSGFPLPKENIGQDMGIVKRDIGYRLLNLDPSGKYRKLYAPLLKSYLGKLPVLPDHPLTIMYSIGGAGAQKEICMAIINNLHKRISFGQVRFVISVGTRKELKQYFQTQIESLFPINPPLIVFGNTFGEYYRIFNEMLRKTDILMTKPSELSFYAGLGIPIVIQPSIGSQEDFNRRWLVHVGAGVPQENPKYIDQWLFDLLETGDLAEMAMQGFVEIEKMGAYTIEKIIAGEPASSSMYVRARKRAATSVS